MTAAIAPASWPFPPGTSRSTPWVFGREVAIEGAAGASRALQWLFKRNCSITPAQLGLVYLSLCSVSLAVAGFFFLQGATLVLAFTSIELLAVGLALFVFARHAGDRELLTLVDGALQVEQCIGTRVQRMQFAADWLSVEPAAGQGSLVELSGRGQLVRIGRFLRPELRALFARELRQALRRQATAPESDPN